MESNPSSQPRTPVGDNRALVDSITENTLPRTHSIDPQLEVIFLVLYYLYAVLSNAIHYVVSQIRRKDNGFSQ